jgi:hypothetical protein
MAEMKVYQREHFQKKIRDLLRPEIEKEEMLMSSTIAEMVESAEKGLAKKIGADIIIEDLAKARQNLDRIENKARTFFKRTSNKRVSWKNSFSHYNWSNSDSITPEKCQKQIRAWAEKLAEKEAEKLPIGKRIAYLKALQTKADDSVMEAHVSSDLRDMLGEILQPAGLSWDRELPAIAPPSADRPDD